MPTGALGCDVEEEQSLKLESAELEEERDSLPSLSNRLVTRNCPVGRVLGRLWTLEPGRGLVPG